MLLGASAAQLLVGGPKVREELARCEWLAWFDADLMVLDLGWGWALVDSASLQGPGPRLLATGCL